LLQEIVYAVNIDMTTLHLEMKGRDHLGDLGVDGRITKWILKK